MKKIFSLIGIALLMASCTEDYKDWAKPFSNDPEEAFSVSFTGNDKTDASDTRIHDPGAF